MYTGTNTIVWLWFLLLMLLVCSPTNFGVIASSLVLLKASRTFPKTSQTVGGLFLCGIMHVLLPETSGVFMFGILSADCLWH